MFSFGPPDGPPPPPTAPPAPDYFDYGSSSDYATAVGQYNTDKSAYDGKVGSRETAMAAQYTLLQPHR